MLSLEAIEKLVFRDFSYWDLSEPHTGMCYLLYLLEKHEEEFCLIFLSLHFLSLLQWKIYKMKVNVLI